MNGPESTLSLLPAENLGNLASTLYPLYPDPSQGPSPQYADLNLVWHGVEQGVAGCNEDQVRAAVEIARLMQERSEYTGFIHTDAGAIAVHEEAFVMRAQGRTL